MKLIKANLLVLLMLLMILLGMYLTLWANTKMMDNYKLYNCIYNNADSNNFNNNPIMVEKIESECICFVYHIETKYLNSSCDYKEFGDDGK